MNIVEALIQARKEIQSWVTENLISKIDKNNPVATGSFSLNRKAESDVGNYSFAEGKDTEASGVASHAEGCETKAIGGYAHTEGYQTEALAYGHAEGMNTKAFAQAHTEGSFTVASGGASHAEGSATTAEGTYSHAEGQGTVASSCAQHAQGTYNVLDVMDDPAAKGKYAHIVGNGDSEAQRSNAHTVAWDGTGWFAGDVYVGGTGQDEGAVKLLSENNVDSTPTEDSENAVSSGGVYQQLDYITTAILGMRPAYIWVNADGTTSKTYAELKAELESERGCGGIVVKRVVAENEETGEQEIRSYILSNENTINGLMSDMDFHLSCCEEGKVYTCDISFSTTLTDLNVPIECIFDSYVYQPVKVTIHVVDGVAEYTYREIAELKQSTGSSDFVINQQLESYEIGGLSFTPSRGYSSVGMSFDTDDEGNFAGTTYHFSCVEGNRIYTCSFSEPLTTADTYDDYAVITFEETEILTREEVNSAIETAVGLVIGGSY